jgi:hypothetical protein
MAVTSKCPRREIDPDATPTTPLLALTFLVSAATAVMWNGLGFVAKHDYDFPEWLTFLLFAVNGAAYALAAFNSGRLLRTLSRHLSPRATLGLALVIQSLVAPLTGLVDGAWALWVVSIVFSLCSALTWSTVESYMSAGRHGKAMRSSIGWWNLTWMGSNTLGLAAMAFFLHSGNGRWAVGVLGPICLIAAVLLWWFPRSPATHDMHTADEHVGTNFASMLGSCRIMLPMSYLLIGTLGPIMPYRLDEVGVMLTWETPLTATWLLTRVFVVAAMWRLQFWHGRWSILGLAGVLLLIGFGLVTIGPGVASIVVGLALIGIGQGLTYYSAIYYALAIGHAKVDAAGTHEGLIGIGYGAGPAVGLLGLALGGGAAVGWIVLALSATAILPAARPWCRSRGDP